jgi:hypothetical protein
MLNWLMGQGDCDFVVRGDFEGEIMAVNYSSYFPKKKKNKSNSKIEKVMREFGEGKLHSGSKTGPKVRSKKQKVKIVLEEKKRHGG